MRAIVVALALLAAASFCAATPEHDNILKNTDILAVPASDVVKNGGNDGLGVDAMPPCNTKSETAPCGLYAYDSRNDGGNNPSIFVTNKLFPNDVIQVMAPVLTKKMNLIGLLNGEPGHGAHAAALMCLQEEAKRAGGCLAWSEGTAFKKRKWFARKILKKAKWKTVPGVSPVASPGQASTQEFRSNWARHVCAGSWYKVDNGKKIMFDESSGHYGMNWMPTYVDDFVKIMRDSGFDMADLGTIPGKTTDKFAKCFEMCKAQDGPFCFCSAYEVT